jgi:hypothetical protein
LLARFEVSTAVLLKLHSVTDVRLCRYNRRGWSLGGGEGGNFLTMLMFVCPSVTEIIGYETGRLLTVSIIGCSKVQGGKRETEEHKTVRVAVRK